MNKLLMQNTMMQGCRCRKQRNNGNLNQLPVDNFNLGNVASVGIIIDNTTALKLFAVILAAQAAANLLTR